MSPSLADRVLACLRCGDEMVRLQALRMLLDQFPAEVLGAIKSLRQHPDETIRQRAHHALCELAVGHEGAFPVEQDAGEKPSQEAQVALEELCRNHWHSLYAYVRAHRYSASEAQDLIQGFFIMVLRRQMLNEFNPSRGTLKSFLIRALKDYLRRQNNP